MRPAAPDQLGNPKRHLERPLSRLRCASASKLHDLRLQRVHPWHSPADGAATAVTSTRERAWRFIAVYAAPPCRPSGGDHRDDIVVDCLLHRARPDSGRLWPGSPHSCSPRTRRLSPPRRHCSRPRLVEDERQQHGEYDPELEKHSRAHLVMAPQRIDRHERRTSPRRTPRGQPRAEHDQDDQPIGHARARLRPRSCAAAAPRRTPPSCARAPDPSTPRRTRRCRAGSPRAATAPPIPRSAASAADGVRPGGEDAGEHPLHRLIEARRLHDLLDQSPLEGPARR